MAVLEGVNLILSIDGKALGFSTGCKITTTTETGQRQTKESEAGKWPEEYAKSFSEEISADGLTITDGSADKPSYDQLKEKQLAGEPIECAYGVRGEGREGSTTNCHKGNYLITSLELDGQANDDSKYSVKLKSVGKVSKVGTGLTSATQAGS